LGPAGAVRIPVHRVKKHAFPSVSAEHGAAVEIGVDHILPVQDQHVIVVVDAQTTETAGHPAIRERLGPGEIDFITWRPTLRGHA